MKQTLAKAPVSAAAARMRRHRQRRRDGMRSLTIEVREAEIDALIRSGSLEKSSRNDPNAVTQALYQTENSGGRDCGGLGSTMTPNLPVSKRDISQRQ
jgi:hypothetical protein